MSTAKTARRALSDAARLSKALTALRDLYGVLPTATVTPDGVLVAIPWHIGRSDMREALAGDIAELLGAELTVQGSSDEDDPYLDLVADGEIDGARVHIALTFPPAIEEQPA